MSIITKIKDFPKLLIQGFKVYPLAFKAVPKITVLYFITGIIAGIIPFLQIQSITLLINHLTSGVQNPNANLWFYLLFLAGVNALSGAMSILDEYIFYYFVQYFSQYLDLKVWKKKADIDISTQESPTYQNLIQVAFTKGSDPLLNTVLNHRGILKGFVTMFFAVSFTAIFDWKILVVILLIIVPRLIISLSKGRRNYSIVRENSPLRRRFLNFRGYVTEKAAVIQSKLLQNTKIFIDGAYKINDEYMVQKMAQENKFFKLQFAYEIFSAAGFFYAFSQILKAVISKTIPVGQMYFLINSVYRIEDSLSSVLSRYSVLHEDSRYVTEIFTFFNIENKIQTKNGAIVLSFSKPPTIVFENVSFQYGEAGGIVIKNLNLTIEPGQKVGLVGNNGAGKSTFVKLLCRIYDPTEGRILIDGHDLRDIDLESWWKYVAVLMQDFTTYVTTAEESIALGQNSEVLDEKRVVQSAKMAAAHEFISDWKKGYKEELSPEFDGIEPSKGQRQKIALARVLYRTAPVLILDEPTAAVDAESEKTIFDHLEKMTDNTTAILISHDFSTIRRADRIVVLNKGSLIQDGTHEQLMKDKKGMYAELYTMQLEGYTK